MNRDDVLSKLRNLKPWLSAQGVGRVRLFGSYARNEARPDSDVDLIVDLTRPLGLEFFQLEEELSRRLGAPVHMTTEAALRNRIVRREALGDAIDA